MAPRARARLVELLVEKVLVDCEAGIVAITFRPSGLRFLTKSKIAWPARRRHPCGVSGRVIYILAHDHSLRAAGIGHLQSHVVNEDEYQVGPLRENHRPGV
ncbi:MAG TPA: hypothetical protein VK995_03685 [Oceanipulchritudo sp.]|nr:hypothetical protein [Oceanipulchritudo sp.]